MTKITCFALSALALGVAVGCGDNVEPDDHDVIEEPVAFPRTCAELAKGHPKFADGEHTLYVGNDATKPWKAYCADLQSATPTEYLTVTWTWSTYGTGNGDQVRTEYDKVRIDPDTLKLDTRDQTFAVSTGSAIYAGDTITSLPLGVAMSCGNNPATAQVSVEGTPFVLENHFVVRGDAGAAGYAGLWPNNKVVEMWADADCGWTAPDLMSANPIRDAGGLLISLRYE